MHDPCSNRLHLTDVSDLRLSPFRQVKDRELAREGARFIVEGENVVKRLLASDFPVESVVLAERRSAELSPLVRPDVPLYVVPDAMIHELVGFKFHSGVIACGVRKPPLSIDRVIAGALPQTIVICPEIANAENLGGLIRLSAGFGAAAMVLGPRSCDPFFRQAIRVSMGTVFTLPIVQSADLLADLSKLKSAGVELIATVLDADAESLARCSRGDRIALLFGNEAQGLERSVVAMCDRRVTIPMQWGTDSLNVAVAAGIVLFHFTQDVSAKNDSATRSP